MQLSICLESGNRILDSTKFGAIELNNEANVLYYLLKGNSEQRFY